ncbi:MAG: methyltransferase domain-containing protein [Betaproteobacteria bacterium]|nr:methyltransferase domain-containing protein [Betaproteobacteria bacterium]
MALLFPPQAPLYVLGESKINISAVKPVAIDSPDHIVPWGTARDNSTHLGFNAKLLHWIPKAYLSVLDIGCSGGGFVRSMVNEGVFAVGVEGSDYSKLRKRAEWDTIPDRLFTADATAPFQLDFAEKDGSNLQPLQFSVITAWEMIEHVREEDLQTVFSNIDKHLIKNGVVVMSISPNDDFIEGVNLHQCVHEKSWWIDKLRSLGWENHDFLVDFFEPDWIRSEPNAPGSFHVCLTRVGCEPLFEHRIDRNAYIFSKHGQPSGAIGRLLADRFSFQSDPVVVCDAGVRGGFEGIWGGFEHYLHFVGIDVDVDATVGLQPRESTSRQSLISKPIASAPGNAIIYRTRNDVASSFLPPNWEYIKRFPQMVPGEIVGQDEMEFVAFRSELAEAGVSRVDYLKLDIEGYELEALKGLGSIRDSLLCVSVEIFFQPYRFGSPTYGMIEDYLRPLGFSLFDLQLERWKRQCVADPNNPHTWYGERGQIMWGQAIFLKDPILSGETLDPSKAARLAFIADVLGFKDFSLELVTRYNLLRLA